jgi:hypothetical protein
MMIHYQNQCKQNEMMQVKYSELADKFGGKKKLSDNRKSG